MSDNVMGPSCGQGRRRFGRGFDGQRRFAPDMPQEIRVKAVEAAKLRIDLEDVLSQAPIDRAKASDLHSQIMKLDQEVEAWRFNQRLDHIEDFRKQQELNRTVPPKHSEKSRAAEAEK
ncbi:MAG: hypothetical protein IJ702_10135 [Fretibacterium sp.]|nr:hypothetical protein [Fretibacterium sp.]